MIEREKYLDWLIQWKDKHMIKVISGVKGCGSSTLFLIYQSYLRKNGVKDEQIKHINFEDLEYEDLTNYRPLYKYLIEKISPTQMNYIFLDEIQNVEGFEKVVDSIFLKDNCDIYLTGSNAYMLSGELATLLTGRYVELSMMPLSFQEFCSVKDNNLSMQQLLNAYLNQSSFPYVVIHDFQTNEVNEYLRGIFNTILLNDVVKRLHVKDVNILESITKYLMHNIGNITSPSKISGYLTSNKMKVDPKTVDKYIRGLTDSLLLYDVPRYNIRGKELLVNLKKYYVCDVTLRALLVRSSYEDIGHILENVVYLELKRRYREVYVGQMRDNLEVDFVAIQNGIPTYYQVCQTTLDENVLKRELKPLEMIHDNYEKYLLTLDEVFAEMNYEGIIKKNVLKWLVNS